MIKSCLLCKNYCVHPCQCEHCERYDRFRISEEGKALYQEILDTGFKLGFHQCNKREMEKKEGV